MAEKPDPDDVFELLGDRYVRTILRAASEDDMSAKELSEACDSAKSTVYRRIDDLVALGLLAEKTELEADGSHHSVYEANIDHLDVDIYDGTIDVSVHVREDAAQRFSRIWSDIRES